MRERWRSRASAGDDPFLALGLPREAGLSDDDVRAAWRRVAAATHPDREDGGNPALFGAAAAAYSLLRTGYGRGEALADLDSRASRERRAACGLSIGRGRLICASREGRPGVLALRVVAAATVTGIAFVVAGWSPAWVGVLTGALTWLVSTGRHDLPARR